MSAQTASNYAEFLRSKAAVFVGNGIDVPESDIHPALFPFQRDLVRWALRKGRAAIFADCGLGKTIMQLEWARHIPGRVLVVAPLGVTQQTVREGRLIDLDVVYARSQDDAGRGVTITNYEMLPHFDPDAFAGVVIDESSILAAFDGVTCRRIIDMFAGTPYRLACSATPAPNDIQEFANHSEFLGIMPRTELLATFFVHDADGWRLKGHAHTAFYRWLASWGMSIGKPSDLGYDDGSFRLPPLAIAPEFVAAEYTPPGQLFALGLKGVSDRAKVRQATTSARVARCLDIIGDASEPWLVWCGLNSEQDALAHALGDRCVSIYGSLSPDEKVTREQRWRRGEVPILLTKPKIFGHGMNWQHCAKVAFVGLSDSYQYYYQCIRRSWRFGQTRPVDVRIILSDLEAPIYDNVLRKEREATMSQAELIANASQYERSELAGVGLRDTYTENEASGDGWRLLLGDSVQRLGELADNSVDLIVTSPPFAQLYVYSPSERDLGNCRTEAEFLEHFRFVVEELLRVTKPGRVACIHVFDIPAMLNRDGYIGLKDFSGDIIRLFSACGWVFDSRIPIDKNQQAQSIRTHSKGLTMTQMEKDRTWSRPALPDYVLKFRKPGENAVPVQNGDVTRDEWIELANPSWPDETDRCADAGAMATWYGIRETDTLNAAVARENADEKHVCPLQIGTIERCIRLWTNPGEVVLDPFAGIGSTLVTALRHGRRGLGIELKNSYWSTAKRNLERERLQGQMQLFAEASV